MSLAIAQNVRITGTVVDETGEPVIGASVVVKGNTSVGTVTNLDGQFTLDVPSSATELIVRYLGKRDQEVAVAPRVSVTLQSADTSLDEVIVVAYGTAKKSAFTGSATTMKAETIEKRQASNITTTLSGTVSGVQGLSSNGEPGSTSNIRIRGVGSIKAGNSPLYVVDGVPYDGEIASINNADIETVTVLKDAASNALYGARGANGVIIITTKRGKTGEATVNVDAKWGTNQRGVPLYNGMTDPGMYYETAYKALWNAFASPTYDGTYNTMLSRLGYNVYTVPSGERIIGMNGKLNPNAVLGYSDGKYTYRPDDWYAELFNKGNLRQEYNINVSGATDKLNYYISAGYLDDEGIIYNSGFDRFTSRLKADYQAKKWLKVGGNFNFTQSSSYSPNEVGNGTSSGNLFYIANYIAPIYPMYIRDAQGNIMKDARGMTMYDYGDGRVTPSVRSWMPGAQPASAIELDKSVSRVDDISAKWFADVDIYDGLKISASWGINTYNARYTMLANPYYGQYSEMGGYAWVQTNRNLSFDQNYLLKYIKGFGDHNIDLLAGVDSYSRKSSYLGGEKQKIFDPTVPEVGNAINSPSVDSYTREYATLGYLAQARYDYDEKYYLSASFRRDASSVFAPENRWGNFWSTGLAWNIQKEEFMSDLSFIDFLKLKVSYGQQGNDYLYYTGSTTRNLFAYKDQYEIVSNNGNFATPLYYKGNRDITWETSNTLNAGVDFELFDNRLAGTVEYFDRRTSNMLYDMPVASSLGYSSFPLNVGVMSNYGTEIDLTGEVLKTRDITVKLTGNITFLKNKIIKLDESLGGQYIDGSRIYKEGESMYNLYIRSYAGVNTENGASLWYVDEPAESDNTVKDMPDGRKATESYANAGLYATGNTMPTAYGGFGASIDAYGFDLSFQFNYQTGGRLWDYTYQDLMHVGNGNDMGQNWHKDILNAWTPENADSNIPRLNANDVYGNGSSDRWLVSSDFLALQNITLGYTLPSKWTKKFQISSIRFYGVADNLALWSARKGLDPRQGYLTTVGYFYSPMRSISGGIKLTF
jgi:TonB-linked SusC/RagA family outer membrane protein